MIFLVLVSAAVTYVVISRQCCQRKPRRRVSAQLVSDSADL